MKHGDKLAEALNSRRARLGLTMRDVADRTAELEKQDPKQYQAVSRGTVSNLENGGLEFFQSRSRPIGQRRMNALVAVLFYGDAEQWLLETGMDALPISRDSIDVLRPRPVYQEGASSQPAEIRAGRGYVREERPAVPWADALLEITTSTHAPMLRPGMSVGISLSSIPAHRGLILMSRGGVLTLAWHVKRNLFAENAEPDAHTFGLAATDTVLGHVAWVVPSLSD